MSKKTATIEDLARMVQDGFSESRSHVEEQFTQVGKQFVEVHRELKAIREDLLGVIYRPEFDDSQDRVREVETAHAMFKKKAA
jgi:hypothetical protein